MLLLLFDVCDVHDINNDDDAYYDVHYITGNDDGDNDGNGFAKFFSEWWAKCVLSRSLQLIIILQSF